MLRIANLHRQRQGHGQFRRFGVSPSDTRFLAIRTLQPGEEKILRLLPSFDESEGPYLGLWQHYWPEFAQCRIYAPCPQKTHPALLAGGRNGACRACAANLPIRWSGIVYALVGNTHKTTCIKFTEQNMSVLKRLIQDGCFDLAHGCKVRLSCGDWWGLDYELLGKSPVSESVYQDVIFFDGDGIRGWTLRPDKLDCIVKAHDGWVKSGEAQPWQGQYIELVKRLPSCTLIPIPFGCKGPQSPGWQNTPYELMLDYYYRSDLDEGNVGLLCGRDQAAVEKGLVPDVVIVGLDADTDDFAGLLLQCNPWLDTTFSVTGGRGKKWFFAIGGEGREECLQSTNIKRRVRRVWESGKDEDVGELLSTGRQGVVWGLHPSGRMYLPDWKPLVTIEKDRFKLPNGYYLAASKPESAATQYQQFKRLIGDTGPESSDPILDIELLENVHSVGKGIEAACPDAQARRLDSEALQSRLRRRDRGV